MSDARLVDEAVALATELAHEAAAAETRRSRRRRRRLARLIHDPDGLPLALGLTDEVVRIADDARAGRRLAAIVDAGIPASLTTFDRLGLRLAAVFAPRMPSVVLPLVRLRIRAEARGLVLPAEPRRLGRHLARRQREGMELNVNLLGEAVLGRQEADLRLDAIRRLVRRPDVDHVSVKLSAVTWRLSALAFDQTVDHVVERLGPLFADAERHDTLVNLDMEEYRDLWLTTEAFGRLVAAHPEVRAGIVLQAYLPDAVDALEQLAELGPLVKIRLVKGANLAMERVDAELHGWPQAPYATKAEVDASYKRLLERALQGTVRIGVGSHNLFDVAWALTLARHHDAGARLDIEMLEGMAEAEAQALRRRGHAPRLYTPIVHRRDFDASIAYLARRLEENTQSGNFLREAFDLDPAGEAWRTQEAAFRRSVEARHDIDTSPRRPQDRRGPEVPAAAGDRFANEPDTDFSLAANRAWIAEHLARPDVPSVDGPGPVRPGIDPSTGADLYQWHAAPIAEVDRALVSAREAGRRWCERPAPDRVAVLRRCAEAFAARRGHLIAVAIHDGGKTVGEADTEVSEAIDFARYYACSALEVAELERDGLRFTPHPVVAVVPPWNFPVAIPAGGAMAALAAGSAVLLKPAPETVACAAAMVEACWDAGVPRDALQLVPCDDDEAGRHLVTSADAVVLTGAVATARMFQSWKPTIRLHAETSGKNAIVVSVAADLDAAVRDIVRSAFGHAGQKCSAASLVIAEAAIHDDPRFLRQLADATRSLHVGSAADPRTDVGPLIRPPDGDLRRGLTTLEPGERWLVEPRALDGSDRLWTPGIRTGVLPGSWFHRTECFGPVLGVMRAPDLETAVRWQNATPFGLTGGIQSLDPGEVDRWTEAVEVGNAYVNRTITGAIVGRQPFGGWKSSAVGATAKAGGPGYVMSLGRWEGTGPCSYSTWWPQLATPRDPQAMRSERNRWSVQALPTVAVRFGTDAPAGTRELVAEAAACTGTRLVLSSADEEDDVAFAARIPSLGADRLRLVGTVDEAVWRAAHECGLDVVDAPVVGHGRVELPRWARERVVTEVTHRYGNVRRAATSTTRRA
ncbi:MAG TPA: bifunctional proline dehydrogenase/L-glutamate gamma-semialdehyde dehydrogenase [Aquihabitans sp.]|jgi:RHH-type proline utilization regulon transcriptional repressor/proline dehydrogenase/delta 1-pyrroline-5-carboxylate dehydrogenase|nr:bifunctional proline dehydrogenase/L-glutamate gamma-semialdehyde dehydrogenase [Aquihabitans sp.]